jgi:hypothetical protein
MQIATDGFDAIYVSIDLDLTSNLIPADYKSRIAVALLGNASPHNSTPGRFRHSCPLEHDVLT